MTPRFGISTHMFHGERLTRAHFQAFADHGFDLVEVFATRSHFDYRDRRHVDEVKGTLSELGLTTGSMHAPICDSFAGGAWGRAFSNASTQSTIRQEAIDETGAAIEAAAELGCTFIVLHLGLPRGQNPRPGENDPAAARRSVEAIAEIARTNGLRLAIEVIPNDLSTPAALVDLLASDLELGRTGVCLDFGHAHILSGAPEAAETLSGHIMTTHVHDNAGKSDDHLPPFDGTIDWRATLTAMSKIGFGGALVFEVADHGDASRALQRTVGARKRLQAILDELAEPIAFE